MKFKDFWKSHRENTTYDVVFLSLFTCHSRNMQRDMILSIQNGGFTNHL